MSIAISHFVTICTILPDKNDCQGNNIHCTIHLELHLPTNIGRKIAIHFSEPFIFMKLIIHLLKSTSYQPEIFPLQFLKLLTSFTVLGEVCVYYYIFVRKDINKFQSIVFLRE